jgi:exopolyphosphatase/guanosine-5'-triphosphate,3'-diphosphate pyrophosphatase
MSGGIITAGIDVGCNAVKSLVARIEDGRIAEILQQDRRVTRLGEGVQASGRLQRSAITRTCAAIEAMVEAACAAGATSIRAGATSAARDAANTDELIACVREACGVTLEVLPGEEEARLTFCAIRAGEATEEPIAVIDPGGGSTEWVFGRGDQIEFRKSVSVGAVRATERWLPGDPADPATVQHAREEISRSFADLPDAAGRRLIGTGGTLRNLASVYREHAQLAWEDSRRLPGAEIERQIEDYAARTIADRKSIPGLEPDRADIILAGALIAAACLAHARTDILTVTDQGLRQGLALSIG